ncbi:MAG: hypothetical protein HYV27_16790 [Candidatus Hydrogenedentes bacterium]|nr:hypothetical protein [Candidatus Hydrogenedentota bacterium]
MMKRGMQWALVAALCALVAGCATTGGGASREAQIQQTVEVWRTGLLEKDIEKFMSAYSPNFSNSQTSDLAQVKDFFQQAFDQGYVDNAEITYVMTDGKFEEDVFTLYPINVEGPTGTAAVELTLKQEDGKWLITSLEIDA